MDEFAKLISEKRKQKYKSARDFYEKNSISCTYFYYSKIEKGTLPDIQLSVELLTLLELNIKQGLLAWLRDQLQTPAQKALFLDTSIEKKEINSNSTEPQTIENFTVINRMQAKLLATNPVYWELALYIVSHYQMRQIKIPELEKIFQSSREEIISKLNDLYEWGVIDRKDEENYFTKKFIKIPHDSEFMDLRDKNFQRAYEQFKQIESKNKFRTTLTRLLHPKDIPIIQTRLQSAMNDFIDYKSMADEKNLVPFTMGIFSSERKFGPCK